VLCTAVSPGNDVRSSARCDSKLRVAGRHDTAARASLGVFSAADVTYTSFSAFIPEAV